MSSRTRYWEISGTAQYIEQIARLPTPIQSNIEHELIELSYVENPRTVGTWADCGSDDEECPYIVQIFPGLPFEFMYEMNPNTRKLLFLDCYALPIFNSFSID